jgi:urocanate hydratase
VSPFRLLSVISSRFLADTAGSWTSIEAQIYVGTYKREPEPARQACMAALVGDLSVSMRRGG